MKTPRPFLSAILFAALASCLLIACTDADADKEIFPEIAAGIGNDCGPADEREVWLRVEADSNATRCPSATLDGIRIRLLQGGSLDSLKTKITYMVPAHDCRDTVIHCPQGIAAVYITEITPTTVRGSYELLDSAATGPKGAFKAMRCIVSPHCG